MRIAFIADALDNQYAGIHIYTREIIKALAKTDSEHTYIAVRLRAGTEFVDTSVEELVVPSPALPAYAGFRLFVKIPQLLAKAKVDIVVEPRHFGPFNLPKPIKRVTVIHDLTPVLFPEMHEWMSSKLQRWFLPSILKRTDHIITNSKYTKGDVLKVYPFTKEKTTAILLGKETIFQPTSNDAGLVKYGVRSPFILSVGTLEPRKNLSRLLAAFESLKQSIHTNFQLVLVGKKGWKNRDLMERIATSPFSKDIVLTGYVERMDLPALYSSAAFFVYPSLYEGFGLPLLEAMACGTAILASKVSSLPEVGGEAALYFDPYSVQDLTQQLIRLVQNDEERERRAHSCLQRSTQFSWEKAAKETKAVFERIKS